MTQPTLRPFLLALLLLLPAAAMAQVLNPAQWAYSVEPAKPKAGQTAELVIRARLDEGWHLYSNEMDPNLGPLPTDFKFNPSPAIQLVGKPKPIGVEKHYSEVWGGDEYYFTGKAEFRQKIRVLKAGQTTITGTVEGQVCTDAGKCIPVSDDFSVTLTAEPSPGEVKKVVTDTKNQKIAQTIAGPALEAEKDTAPAVASVPAAPMQEDTAVARQAVAVADSIMAAPAAAEGIQAQATAASAAGGTKDGLWGFFLLAFLSGFVALLTPCVFPMIPMTVSFFTRSAQSRARAIGNAWLYALSIVALYVLIGVIFSRLNGPEFANFISTHWLPNVLFFAIFLIFGFSFLGYFEILLPSSWGNAADARAEKGGLAGIFFMALTLVIVSFSCTGPIASTVLVQSAGGAIVKPVVGMLGFSLAFALPFGLFAAFPQWLQTLPRSGSWMVTVKSVLGFLELALALKFLSVADQAYHWNLLDREVYLALWIVIFSLLGFYLLGKVRLPHDAKLDSVGWGRLAAAILTLSFVVYLVPGMFGAPLKALAGYIPPQSGMDFDLTRGPVSAQGQIARNTLCEPPRHADFLHLPHGLQGYFDYQQALACAKASGKPLFIDFTGHGCVNCREMEARVWSDPRIHSLLSEKFVIAALYVDDKTVLPESAWYTSHYDGKVKKTLGKQNADFQITRFNNNAQPFYVVLDGDGKMLSGPHAYDLSVEEFERFLLKGLESPTAVTRN